MKGKVVTNKMNKTVVVEVERLVMHPVYKKRVKKTKRFSAHSEKVLELGTLVEIVPSKPFSKTKRHKVVEEVIKKEKNNDSK